MITTSLRRRALATVAAGMLAVSLATPAAVAQEAAAAPTDLLITEYVEGSGNNKALEFTNLTGADVDLSQYAVVGYHNGGLSRTYTIALTGTLADGESYVFGASQSGDVLLPLLDQTSGTGLWNGNDAIALQRGDVVVDSIGERGNDATFAANVTLRRLEGACTADPDLSDATDLSAYEQLASDTFDGLGTHDSTCGGAGGPTDLFISEYVEGSSNNKAIELYNGTAGDIALDGYRLEIAFNGSTTAGATIDLEGTVAAGDVFVVADNDFVGAGDADQVSTSNFWNGDDTIVLRGPDGEVVDAFGQLGVDPGAQWGSEDTGAQNNTLRRNPDVCQGDTDPTDAFDPADEYTGFGQDVFDGLGSHTAACGGGGGTGGDADGLLVTEVVVTPTAGEFVEIHNAGSTTIALDDVYLTDATFAGGGAYYYNIVTGENAGGGGFSDFHARFPEGATIAPGEYQTIAMNGTGYATTYGVAADYELFGESDAPDMREALPGSIGGQGGLTNGAEVVVLYTWDGQSDLVQDLDYVVWGDTDEAVDKTGVSIDGPDDDSDSSTYADDTPLADQDLVSTSAHASGDSFQRADLAEGEEVQAGGNGLSGSDETSENLSDTWCVAPVTPGAEGGCDDGTGGEGGECGDPTVTIGSVQGDGAATPIPGQTVQVEATVVGDFQTGGFDGYYVQDAGDGDAATSDGIFVYDEATDVSAGDVVHITGTVSEFFTMTQITPSTVVVCATGTELPAPTEVRLPTDPSDLDGFDGLERYEGMYVTFPQDLAILEYFNYDRFGEIALGTERQYQPTAVYEPGSPEAEALAAYNAAARITLDDGSSFQNPDVTRHPNGDPFTLDNRFRGGDLVTNVTGVLDYRFNLYRVQPTEGAEYTSVNPRPEVPEVGGTMTVASFNVLNYFPTLDDGTNDICGPSMTQECRGADTAEEFARQEAKIVAALAELDADVVGLMEIENSPTAVETLVAALNAEVGAGTYAAIETGYLGTDAIKVALIYKPATVTPLGDYAVLDQSVDARFLDSKNRPALAQTFVEDATGSAVTVSVNHLKSKGSSCSDVGDPTDPDGQGNCNQVRADAAAALVDWMAADPTGTGAENALIIGDLNSYDQEDPIDVLVEAGWTDLLALYEGEYAYTYVFDGQLGYLDYALANPAVLDDVTGAAAWHANADEPDLLDYDMSFKSDGQDAIYAPDPYRASDHDAVLVGLAMPNVDTTAPTLTVTVTPDMLWPPNGKYRTVEATIEVSDDLDDDVEVELVSVVSDEPDNGEDDGNTVDDIVIVDDTTFELRAERSGSGDGRTYTITYLATDDAGNTTTATATVEVPLGRGR